MLNSGIQNEYKPQDLRKGEQWKYLHRDRVSALQPDPGLNPSIYPRVERPWGCGSPSLGKDTKPE